MVSITCLAGAFAQAPGPLSNLTAVLQTYCEGCHNQNGAQAGLALDKLNADPVSANADSWERVLRQLRARTMPPVGSPRPNQATYESVISSLAGALDRGKPVKPQPGDSEIATRLATLLWNGPPDQQLLDDAKKGRLKNPAILEQQVRRMLTDPKSKAFITGFFDPWLQLERLENVKPDPQAFPDFDESLRQALRQETELFVESQLHDDRDPLDLWSANYTFVNERLARHYGIPQITGSEFRKVPSPAPERAGLLGQGSILTITAHSESNSIVGAPTTSPAARGAWIRRHFLGVNTPPPAPNVPNPQKGIPLTVQSRTFPASPCMNCHRNFFPLGYGLESFGPLGQSRTQEGAYPVDASGAMVDGTAFNGAAELRRALFERSDAFHTTITEKLLAYAVKGQPDMTVVRAVLRDAEPKNYRWSALVAGIVTR